LNVVFDVCVVVSLVIGVPCVEVILFVVVFVVTVFVVLDVSGVAVAFVVVVFGTVEDEVFTMVGFAVCFSGVVSVGFACDSVIVDGINIVFDVTAAVDCSCVVAKVANKSSFFVLENYIK